MKAKFTDKPNSGYLDKLINFRKLNHFLAEITPDLVQAEELFAEGDFVRKALDISEEQLSQLYKQAHHYFAAEDYQTAAHYFLNLALFDHSRPEYWLCFAHCAYCLRKYETALNAYAMTSLLDPHDPRPLYYIGQCFLNQARLSEAVQAFDATIAIAHHEHRYREWEEKALLQKNNLHFFEEKP